MQIQVNTDNNVIGSADIEKQIDEQIRSALSRFADRITRVEVHIQDLNADKSTGDDKRCQIEARVAGRQPQSVSHNAPAVSHAVDGACGKLVCALDTTFGKLDSDLRRSEIRQTKHDAQA